MGIEPMHCGFADRRVTTSPLHQIKSFYILIEIKELINKSPPLAAGEPNYCVSAKRVTLELVASSV